MLAMPDRSLAGEHPCMLETAAVSAIQQSCIADTALFLHTVSTVGVDAEAAIALLPNPIANTVLPSKVVKVNLRL